MNRWFLFIALVIAGLAANAQSMLMDTGTFNSGQPRVDDYITLWGIMIFDLDGYPREDHNIDTVAKFLKGHPNVVFRVEFHTDCRGSNNFNIDYSQRIADSIRARLIMRTGNGTQLPEAVGRGEEELLVEKCRCDLGDTDHNCTEAEHQKNRRTVLKVIAVKEY